MNFLRAGDLPSDSGMLCGDEEIIRSPQVQRRFSQRIETQGAPRSLADLSVPIARVLVGGKAGLHWHDFMISRFRASNSAASVVVAKLECIHSG